MNIFKKKKTMSQIDFIDTLLKLRREIEVFCIKAFEEDFNCSKGDSDIVSEIQYFSLWIIMISLPPNNNELKDILYDRFFEKFDINTEEDKKWFFEDVDIRYKNYYAALNMWQNNPKNGHMIGTVIVEIIKNKNSDFSLKEKIPTVGATEAMQAFKLFSSVFESILKIIGEIKKEYNIEN